MKRLVQASIFVSLVVAACSSHPTTDAPYVPPAGDRVGEQADGTCPTPSQALRGSKAAGDACSQGADCAPTCCQCGNGTNRSWNGVHCSSGVCAGATQACTDTFQDHYCTVP